MADQFVIGIDGGGTGCRAVAVSQRGLTLAEAQGGPLNYHTTSPGIFRTSLVDVLNRLKGQLSASAEVAHTVIGTAALFMTADEEETATVCEGILPLQRLTLLGDVLTALHGATMGRPGVMVISGTGSIAAAMSATGKFHTTGGLGPKIQCDPGSALWIASEILIYASNRSCNGCRPDKLTRFICDFLEVDQFTKIVPALYSDPQWAKRLAGLSRGIVQSPLSAESFTRDIFRRAGRLLAGMAGSVAEPLLSTQWSGDVHIAGSVLKNRHVREGLRRKLKTLADRPIRVATPALDAARGAALLALNKAAPECVPAAAKQMATKTS